MEPLNLVWLRRDLRLHDHAALSKAFSLNGKVQPVFVFDKEILTRFSNPNDRRLTFIVETLIGIHQGLKKRGGGLLLLYGNASELIPETAKITNCEHVIAAEDYEPDTRKRDRHVKKAIQPKELVLVKDHVIVAPEELTRNNNPYKVYTPYAKAWLDLTMPDKSMHYEYEDHNRYADIKTISDVMEQNGIAVLDADEGARTILNKIGYNYIPLGEWDVKNVSKRLDTFIKNKSSKYDTARDFLAEEGTSKISPYLRFGLISIRECYQKAYATGKAQKWIGELIWREFYMMILYYFPESAYTEWNPAYRDRIEWSQDKKALTAWKEGRTGYPVVDAAMRQLLEIGWMHNRARMIVASFLTKHLLTDWKKGEEHFAHHLMDYEIASNVGGWQWAASTGTDAQPYFRVFNPYLQSKKFDSNGEYIRRYVPELKNLNNDDIHNPPPLLIPKGYVTPIVNHSDAREIAILTFKQRA